MARKYPGLPRYILETDYGCYTSYGWTLANTNLTFEEGMRQYNFWKEKGRYRLVDGNTGKVLAGESDLV